AIGIGGHAGNDFISDFPDGPVVVRKQQRFRFGPARGARVPFGAHEGDFLADVFLKELLRVEQIVFVVLFDDADFGGIDERTEVHGGRIDGRGDVFKVERKCAGRQAELAHIADEGNVGVVNGDSQIDLVFFGGGGDGG